MGWLRLVGSLKLQVSFAKEPYKRDYVLHKRPIILRRLLIVATPYQEGIRNNGVGRAVHTHAHTHTPTHIHTHTHTHAHTRTARSNAGARHANICFPLDISSCKGPGESGAPQEGPGESGAPQEGCPRTNRFYARL